MSHELRTPLNAILGFSQLISLEAQDNAEISDFSQEIERAGNHLLSLVNDLIDLSRIESGKLDLSMEPITLSSLGLDSIALINPLAEKHHIHLHNQLTHHDDIVILADPLRLKQVIINLLSNGIKYNKTNGSVTLSRTLTEHHVRILVKDTGIGISTEKQSRIFNAFDRLGAECGTIEGSGIGLVITKRLIEAMGGGIGFESTEHHGCTFWLEFPIHAYCITQNTAQKTLADKTEITQTTTRLPVVLCIEDNPVNLKFIKALFAKRDGIVLLEALTGEMGLTLAKSQHPDLILTDIHLPDSYGYQILAQLKADPNTKNIPVIALTADAMNEDIVRAREAGFTGYITKPIDIYAFFDLIDHYLVEQHS